MYFDEDGDLAHEFYEEVLPRYEISTSFDVVSLRVVTTLKNQEKGWQEKNAKNREESQVRSFVLCLYSILGVCHDDSRPQGDVKYNVPCLHVDFPIILYSD